MITYKIKPFTELYERVYEKNRIKMKAYTAVQRKLLVIIYTLWKKDEEFDGDFQDRASREKEQEPSLTFLVNEKSVCKIIALEFTRATLDRHPSKYRRLPSLT